MVFGRVHRGEIDGEEGDMNIQKNFGLFGISDAQKDFDAGRYHAVFYVGGGTGDKAYHDAYEETYRSLISRNFSKRNQVKVLKNIYEYRKAMAKKYGRVA
jgi:hypothetical protein